MLKWCALSVLLLLGFVSLQGSTGSLVAGFNRCHSISAGSTPSGRTQLPSRIALGPSSSQSPAVVCRRELLQSSSSRVHVRMVADGSSVDLWQALMSNMAFTPALTFFAGLAISRINKTIGFPEFFGVSSSGEVKALNTKIDALNTTLSTKIDVQSTTLSTKMDVQSTKIDVQSTKIDVLIDMVRGAAPIARRIAEEHVIQSFNQLEIAAVKVAGREGVYEIRAALPSGQGPLSAVLPHDGAGTPFYKLRLIPLEQHLFLEVERTGSSGPALSVRELSAKLRKTRIKVERLVVIQGPDADAQSDVWVCKLW